MFSILHVADFWLNICSLELIKDFFQFLAVEKHFPMWTQTQSKRDLFVCGSA